MFWKLKKNAGSNIGAAQEASVSDWEEEHKVHPLGERHENLL